MEELRSSGEGEFQERTPASSPAPRRVVGHLQHPELNARAFAHSPAQHLKRFEDSLARAEGDDAWKQCLTTPLQVWKQMDTKTGLHMLRMRGVIPAPVDLSCEVLYSTEIRKLWDKSLIEQVEYDLGETWETAPVPDAEALAAAGLDGKAEGSGDSEGEDTDDSVSDRLVYIAVKSPPGVRNRDFSHRRIQREADGRLAIVDVSVEDDRIPSKKGFIRAHTLYSGAIVSKVEVDGEEHTHYDTITHIDVRGDVPKPIINAIAAGATKNWWKQLVVAVDKHKKGTLKK